MSPSDNVIFIVLPFLLMRQPLAVMLRLTTVQSRVHCFYAKGPYMGTAGVEPAQLSYLGQKPFCVVSAINLRSLGRVSRLD